MWPIFKKELKSYFNQPTAYILLVVFLVVNSFFFFRSIYAQGVASLRPLFDFLPWILLFLVPAVTMRLVSEEQRQKTIEVVLAHPVRMSQFLVAKFVAAVAFLMIPLLLTIPIPLLLSSAGAFDGGQIVGQYVAAIGLVTAMVSIGVFASALTMSQVSAFLIAIAISFFFLISGLEVVVVGLSGFLRTIFEQLSILAHYQAMIRGVLDLRDGIFILSFSLCFLLVAYLLLVRSRVRVRGGAYQRLKAGVVVCILVSVALNLIGSRIPGRIDFTRGDLYTLSVASKQFFRTVPDVVTLTLYRSKHLPTQIAPIDREVRDVLADIARVSRGNVRFRIVKVVEGERSESDAQRKGVVPVQFNTIASQAFTLQKGYFGVTLSYADKTERIPFVQSVNDLEYQLLSLVRKLTVTTKKKIGFLAGHGEKTESSGSTLFREELAKQYEVSDVFLTADHAAVENDISVLVIAGPRQAISREAADAIVAFVNRGGSLLALADPIQVNPQILVASPNPASLAAVLGPFGITLDQNLVFDLRSQENVSFGGGFLTYVVPYPFWPRVPAVPGNPVTGETGFVSLPWPSSVSLDRTKQPDAEVFEVLKTTSYAGAQTENFQIRPDTKLSVDQSSFSERLMAVAMVLGKESKDVDTKDTGSVASRGRILAVGDSDFVSDTFVQGSGSGSMSLVFGLNSVDWLAQDEAFIGIRSKNRAPQPLVFASQQQPVVLRAMNLIGIPFLVVVIGSVHLWRRRRKTKFVYQTEA